MRERQRSRILFLSQTFGQAPVGHLESECCRIGFKKSIFVAILILRRLGILGATLIFAR